MTEQWAPFAIKRPPAGAAADKHGYPSYPEPHRKRGIVCHSLEGGLAAGLGELDKVTRRASWTFTNPKVGPLLQHFAVGQHTWASGSLQANVLYTSMETEGVAGEPLNENQNANLVRLLEWLHAEQDWPGYGRLMELWEHKEAVAQYGGGATACPSDRYDWDEILRRLSKPTLEDDGIMPVPWVRDTTNGKSYVIVAGRKRHVESKAQEDSYIKAKYIRRPEVLMSTAELAAIPDA